MIENTSPDQTVSFDQTLTVKRTPEPGILISEKLYERLMERLEGCAPQGWPELWLAGAGASAGIAGSAIAGVLTLAPTSTRIGELWILAGAGIAITAVCLLAYFALRISHRKKIGELKRDMKIFTGN
jgi:hypothetical protein